MLKQRVVRLANIRRRTLFIAVALMAPLGVLGVASPALALTGGFKAFEQCPIGNPEVSLCLHAETESGHFTIGKKTVPIVNHVTLQGGVIEKTELSQSFVGAVNGDTLSKTPQPVPGGLLGILAPEFLNKEQKEKFEELINKGPTGVNATVELAAPATSIGISDILLEIEEGPALVLPVKVHLENLFLGSSCYIGSNSSPLIIELTTGTSGKLKGKKGTIEYEEEGQIAKITHNSLVNNTFAAPGANGCGIFKGVEKVVDEAVDSELGLPAAAGTNQVVLEGTIKQAAASAVSENAAG